MTILDSQFNTIGQVGNQPANISLKTDNSLEEVMVTGFLNKLVRSGFVVTPGAIAEVTLQETPGAQITSTILSVQFDGTNWSLESLNVPGDVELPTTVNHIASFSDTTGGLQEDANPAINLGEIQAGILGNGFGFRSYAPTNGYMRWFASNMSGGNNYNAAFTTDAWGQSATVTVPDPGAGAGNGKFLLDRGAANQLAEQTFIGLSSVVSYIGSTWTVTRNVQGNFSAVRTPVAGQSIIALDVTAIIRAATAKGFRLDSFDVIYTVGAADILLNTATLCQCTYANNAAPVLFFPNLNGTLPTAVQAQPYVSRLTVNAPAYLNTLGAKYMVEVALTGDVTSAYAFYGLMLNFTQTIG